MSVQLLSRLSIPIFRDGYRLFISISALLCFAASIVIGAPSSVTSTQSIANKTNDMPSQTNQAKIDPALLAANEQALLDKITSEKSQTLKLELRGDLAVLHGNKTDALKLYKEAFDKEYGDIDINEKDRERIDKKYLAELKRNPRQVCVEFLHEFAKRVLSDRTASPERKKLALEAAGIYLNTKFDRPAPAKLNEYALNVVGLLNSPVSPWDATRQGTFLISMLEDHNHAIWVGTEDYGVWRHDPITHEWHQFTIKDGLGDDNGYALACDNQDRVWVGHLNHGVSVYEPKSGKWRNYGVVDGPLGSRVFAICVNPVNSDVWIATDLGLTRYSVVKDIWSYYNRTNGLPSNQLTCLACNRKGVLFAGTACDGIAIGTPRDNYKTWRRVTGPYEIPNAPNGDGLPSNLINALLVTHDQQIWAGTTCGLAVSSDSGVNWTYTRGTDWSDKIRGLWFPVDLNPNPGKNLLLEDYVTTLTESDSGLLYIGYRQSNYEVRDPATSQRIYPVSGDVNPSLYMSALLPLDSGYVLMGHYGEALKQDLPFGCSKKVITFEGPKPNIINKKPISFPSPAKAPTSQELARLTVLLGGKQKHLYPGDGYYMGDDWVTQGDWIGRYGRNYAMLCAASSPLDHEIVSDHSYYITAVQGPHKRDPKDGLRRWVQWIKTDNSRCLYDPVPGYRRQADWDDHAEEYDWSYEGPDIWITVDVPVGIHRLSLYHMNKDGHEGTNRSRDYLVELRQYSPSIEEANKQPPIARARVRDFWGGVYKQFVVAGPTKFYVKVAKNNSFNTTVSGVMLDNLSDPDKNITPNTASSWFGALLFNPTDYIGDLQDAKSRHKVSPPTEAVSLWNAAQTALNQGSSLNFSQPYGLLAYRACVQQKTGEDVLYPWRLRLRICEPQDRQRFNRYVTDAHSAMLRANPDLVGKDF